MANRAAVRQVTSVLTAALHVDASTDELARLLEGQSAEFVVGVAVNQQVDQLVLPRLVEAGLDVPSGRLSAVEGERAKERLLLRRGMRAVAEALDSAAIPWVVVKGPAIARHDPPEQQRPSSDLDVLVSLQRFREALEVLEAHGVVEDDEVEWQDNMHHRLAEVDLDAAGCTIDLHWDLISLGSLRDRFNIDTDALLERRRVAPFDDVDLPLPDATDTLLHVVLHAGLSGANHLRWFVDIQKLIVHDPPDWDAFVSRSREAGAARMVGLVLERGRRVTGTGPPAEVTDALLGSFAQRVGPWLDRWPRDPTGPGDGAFATTPIAIARDSAPAMVGALLGNGLTRVVDKVRAVVPGLHRRGTRAQYMAWVDDLVA